MLIPAFSEQATRIPTDEQLVHFTTRKRSYIHTMQQLVPSSPQKDATSSISSITRNSSLDVVGMVTFQRLWYTKPWSMLRYWSACYCVCSVLSLTSNTDSTQNTGSSNNERFVWAYVNICKTVKQTSLPENPWPLTNSIILSSIHLTHYTLY